MKPKFTIRKGEGHKSLFRRAKAKLTGEALDKFKQFEYACAPQYNMAQVYDALERFFELEIK